MLFEDDQSEDQSRRSLALTQSPFLWVTVALIFHLAIVVTLPRVNVKKAFDLTAPHLVDLVDLERVEETIIAPPNPPSQSPSPKTETITHPVPARAPAILGQKQEGPNPNEIVSSDHPDGSGGPSQSSSGGTDPPSSSSFPPGPPTPPPIATPSAKPPPPPPPPPSIDRSRVSSLVRTGEWSCPWPNEAELEQIDEAVVVILAVVSERGVATDIRVAADPGHGFGREARRCAMRERYMPALDREGRPIASITKPIRVRFSR